MKTLWITSFLLLSTLAQASDWEELNAKGVEAAQKGDLAKAASFFEKAIVDSPKKPKPHYNLAKAREAQGQGAKALNHFVDYYNLLDEDDAERTPVLGEMVKLSQRLHPPPRLSGQDEALLTASKSDIGKKEYTDAEEKVRTVIRHAPWHLDSYVALASLYAAQDEREKAQRAFVPFAAHAPSDRVSEENAKLQQAIAMRENVDAVKKEAEEKSYKADTAAKTGGVGFAYLPITVPVGAVYGAFPRPTYSDVFSSGLGLELEARFLGDSGVGARIVIGFQTVKAKAGTAATEFTASDNTKLFLAPGNVAMIPLMIDLLLGIPEIHGAIGLGELFILHSDSPTGTVTAANGDTYTKLPNNTLLFTFAIGGGSQINLSRDWALTLDFRICPFAGFYKETVTGAQSAAMFRLSAGIIARM